MSGQAIEYFEIDVPYCSLIYGVSPCTAELGVTGDAKCFNSLETCQDADNFDAGVLTLRFAKPADYLPRDIAIVGPWITDIEFTSPIVSLGENIGQRAILKVSMGDYRHSDAGIDKYTADRGYDPYQRGSFWPRFRARYPSVQGFPCRWRIGFVGKTLDQMETRHFFAESFDGPRADGSFAIEARDVLKFLDGDRARIPMLSGGFLAAEIEDDATSAALSPAGIGNAEYPSSNFYVNLGGKEIVLVGSRSGDSLSSLTRAQLGTVAARHAAGDRAQIVERIAAQDPADIVKYILENYTDVPAAYVTSSYAQWKEEVTTYLGSLYTFTFAEPTPVATALSRLNEQAGLALWDDPLAQLLRMRVIRAVPVTADVISEANVLNKTFSPVDQPDKRVSRVEVYYALNDATKRRDDPDNYRQSVRIDDLDSEAIYGLPAIKRVFADGIADGGSGPASRVGNIIIGRYQRPPRRFMLSQFRGQSVVPVLGAGFNLDWRSLQDASGHRELTPTQCVRFRPGPAVLAAELEEMRFTERGEIDPNKRIITIDFAAFNINLRSLHDANYPATFDGVTVIFLITAAAHVGSTSISNPAVDTGIWPGGFKPVVVISGRVQGKGGDGGRGRDVDAGLGNPNNGEPGGVALFLQSAIDLAVPGEVFGGGGGGGGSAPNQVSGGPGGPGGGGGAGQSPGSGGAGGIPDGSPGFDGTTEVGGMRGLGPLDNPLLGAGGNPGLAGRTGRPAFTKGGGAGGAPGAAIDGVSLATTGTWDGSTFTPGSVTGSILGPQIN